MIEKEKHVGGGVTKSKWWILALSEFWMMWAHFHALKSQWSVSLLLIITYLTITMFSVTCSRSMHVVFQQVWKGFSLWLESHMRICQLWDFDLSLAQLLWDPGLCSIQHNKHWGRWRAGVMAAELSDAVSYMLATACSRKSCTLCLQLLQKERNQNFHGTQTFNSTGG